MSLSAYQGAFTRIVLSPAYCTRVRTEGETALAGYDLTATEISRIIHIAKQRGIRITCILARANRLSSIVGALPLTCALLQPLLSALLDRFWDLHPMATLQALPGGISFGKFLKAEIENGRVSIPYAKEVLDFESIKLDLQQTAHTITGASSADLLRIVSFPFDAAPLLSALADNLDIPELEQIETHIVLDFREDPPLCYPLPRLSQGMPA